jgi:hypothetical protein
MSEPEDQRQNTEDSPVASSELFGGGHEKATKL